MTQKRFLLNFISNALIIMFGLLIASNLYAGDLDTFKNGEGTIKISGGTAHIPVMIIEGFITVFAVGFLKKVQPNMLPGHPM